MRVVAGEFGGRRLRAPAGRTTRPTSDRVREAVFNSLHSLGGVEAWTVLDAFAGSGALGIEALSRGAAHALFLDSDRAAVTAVEGNLRDLGVGADRATVRQADATKVDLPDVDLAFADPPYAFDAWPDLLDRLGAQYLVVESNRSIEPTPRWRSVRTKRYGDTVVTVMTRRDS